MGTSFNFAVIDNDKLQSLHDTEKSADTAINQLVAEKYHLIYFDHPAIFSEEQEIQNLLYSELAQLNISDPQRAQLYQSVSEMKPPYRGPGFYDLHFKFVCRYFHVQEATGVYKIKL